MTDYISERSLLRGRGARNTTSNIRLVLFRIEGHLLFT